jgi:hypothetical protein
MIEFQPVWFDVLGLGLTGLGFWMFCQMTPLRRPDK